MKQMNYELIPLFHRPTDFHRRVHLMALWEARKIIHEFSYRSFLKMFRGLFIDQLFFSGNR